MQARSVEPHGGFPNGGKTACLSGRVKRADIERYFQLAHLDSRDRIALFRLAHDVAISGFGGRQALYERFFFGPQNVMASVYYGLYDKGQYVERVQELLARPA